MKLVFIFSFPVFLNCFSQAPEMIYPVGTGNDIDGMTFSADSRSIGITKNTTAFIYGTDQGDLLRLFAIDDNTKIHFSKDNNWIYFRKDKKFHRIERTTGKIEKIDSVNVAANLYLSKEYKVSINSDKAFIEDSNGKARFVYPVTDTVMKDLSSSTVLLSENDMILAFESYRGVKLYFVGNGKLLRISKYADKIKQVLLPAGDKYVLTTDSKYAILWDVHTARKVVEMYCGRDDFDCALNPKGDRLVIWDGRELFIYSLPEGKLLVNIDNTKYDKVYQAFISADGNVVGAVAGHNITLYEVPSGKSMIRKELNFKMASYEFNPGGNTFLVKGKDSAWVVRTSDLKIIARSIKGQEEMSNQGRYAANLLSDDKYQGRVIEIKDTKSGYSYRLMPLLKEGYIVFDEYDRYEGTKASISLLHLVCGEKIVRRNEVNRLHVDGLAEKIMSGVFIKARKRKDLKGCNNGY